jgi:hypothetical protein
VILFCCFCAVRRDAAIYSRRLRRTRTHADCGQVAYKAAALNRCA